MQQSRGVWLGWFSATAFFHCSRKWQGGNGKLGQWPIHFLAGIGRYLVCI
jgi:hypothetical protein